MSELEFEDHEVTQAEHEFYRSFAVILEHLKNRALNAEAEVRQLRKELEVRRDQVEYLNSIRSTPSVAHGTNDLGPQDSLPPNAKKAPPAEASGASSRGEESPKEGLTGDAG